MTLLDQISEALGASGAMGDLAGTLGISSTETDSVVGAAIPAVLGGLGCQATSEGSSALAGLFGADNGSFLDGLGGFFGQGDRTGLASNLVGSIFGSQRGAIEGLVSRQSGGALSVVSRALPMVAPAVLGFVSRFARDESLDADGIANSLGAYGADGELGDILASAADEDRDGFIAGIADLSGAGGLSALLPNVGTAAAGAATSHAAPVAAAAVGATALGASVYGDDDRERTGLGWLGLLLAPVALLILGLTLWQCSSDNGEVARASVAVIEEEAEPEPTAVPEPEPTAAPDPTPVPEPTPTPEPAPVVPDTLTIADIGGSRADLNTMGGLVTQLGFVEALADPSAGPFTVFAPTDAAFEAVTPVLGRLDDEQITAVGTFHVLQGVVMSSDLVPGATFETLSGETLVIDADGNLPGGVSVVEADLVADNGVMHVLGDSILIPGSVQRSLATGDLNALFELEPIQFATASAEILPESVPTLDAAIEVLTTLGADTRLEVQGHTDSDGGSEANQALSERRAASVVAYLVEGGVNADQLIPVGYGETQLKVDPETSPEDKAMNRRIEFVDLTGQ